MGLAVKIVGVSLEMSTMGATSLYGQKVGEDNLKNDPNMLPQVEVLAPRLTKKYAVVMGGILVLQDEKNAVTAEGVVVDKCGHPIAGAEIIERGTMHRTFSDRNGRFTLQISGKRPVLEISHSDMRMKSVRVRKKKAGKIKVVLRKNYRGKCSIVSQ